MTDGDTYVTRRSVLAALGSAGVAVTGGCSDITGSGSTPDATTEPGTGSTPYDDGRDTGNRTTTEDAATHTADAAVYDGTYFTLQGTDHEDRYDVAVPDWPDAYIGEVDPDPATPDAKDGPLREGPDEAYDYNSGSYLLVPGYHESDRVIPVLWADGYFGDEPRLAIVSHEGTEEEQDPKIHREDSLSEGVMEPVPDAGFTAAHISPGQYFPDGAATERSVGVRTPYQHDPRPNAYFWVRYDIG